METDTKHSSFVGSAAKGTLLVHTLVKHSAFH